MPERLEETSTHSALDIGTATDVGRVRAANEDSLLALLADGQRKILLNLGDITYIDSAGLGALISSYTTTKREGGQLKLVSLTKRIQDLLAITMLITVFDTYDAEAEAIDSFSSK